MRARAKAACDPPASAVVLGLLSDGECVQRNASGARRRGNGICHRVGTEGEAADQLGLPLTVVTTGTRRLETALEDLLR